jgi:uncharacterized membrane protein (UPF0136 family)
MSGILVAFIVCALLLAFAIRGVIKTFKRQPVAAILSVICLTPIYVAWAFVKLFTGDITKS